MARQAHQDGNYSLHYTVSFKCSYISTGGQALIVIKTDIVFRTGYVPSSTMIPQRRFSTLLHQAKLYQRHRCAYHNSPLDSSSFTLFEDHQCGKEAFPGTTTAILDVHTNEVWNIEWSHDGSYLASASKDKTAIIWRIDVSRIIPSCCA